MTRPQRLALFVAVALVVVLLLLLTDGDHTHAARHFLSNLLRRMF